MLLDQRIGLLNDGTYYAFVSGHGNQEVRGTLEQVEAALGIRRKESRKTAPSAIKAYAVTLRFQYPSWDEVDGISCGEIHSTSKREAVEIARKISARDGHTIGRGRHWFSAAEVSE